MNYRNTEILDAETLSGAGTKTIDINLAQPISRITLQWIVTKTQQAMNSYCHKDITKIELVDGADVLFSMDGGQCQALCIYDRRVQTMNHGQEINANSQRSTYGIDFGRFLWDPELAFDPTKFRNPQLKITYDSDVSDTGVSSGSLEIWGDVFDEKAISPIGFLSAKKHWESLMGADGTYSYIDLPTDRPIRKMLIQGYYASYEPWYVIEDARLSEDNDRRVVFDVNMEVYHQLRKGMDICVEEQLLGEDPASGTAFYVTPTDYWCLVSLVQRGGTNAAGMGSTARGGVVTVTGAASIAFAAIVKGWLPNHCFHFPFGRQDQIDDWYDVSTKGSVKLRLESGSAGTSGTGAVILQQLRRY